MKGNRPRWDRFAARVVYYATHYTWAFVAVMVLTLVSCAFSIHYLTALETDLRDVYENDVQGGDLIQSAQAALLGIESAAKDLVLYDDARNRDRARTEIASQSAKLRTAVNRAVPRFYTPKAKQAFQSAKEHLAGYQTVLAAYLDGKPDLRGLARLREKTDLMQKDFDLLILNRTANSNQGIADLLFQLRLSLIVTLGIVIVTVVVRLVMYIAGHPGRKDQSQE